VEEVVITVPAHFGDAQRHATQEAAKLAGWDESNVRLLAEPSAAALAYVVEANTDLISGERNVLVSDLGGGTYDVTLLQTQPKTDDEGNSTIGIKIVCKDGSQELGGKLWDDKLEDYVVEQCIEQGHTEDPKADPRLAIGLRERVIRGKEILTMAENTEIVCDGGNTQEVTREKFEDLTSPLMLEVESKLRVVLEQAEERGVSLEDIDPILLVGGSSKMPMVPSMIENVTGKQPQTYKNPDLLVAIGAAYDAYIASGEILETRSGGGIVIEEPVVDIARMAVGLKALDSSKGKEVNAIIIEDGSDFDEEFVREDFVTAEDNQHAIDFDIYEGNSDELEECTFLATVTLELPPDQPKGTKIKVTLKYNESGVIVGSGVCFTSDGENEVPIEIDRQKIAKG